MSPTCRKEGGGTDRGKGGMEGGREGGREGGKEGRKEGGGREGEKKGTSTHRSDTFMWCTHVHVHVHAGGETWLSSQPLTTTWR